MTITDPIVLIVDDSENDTLLMRTVFERAGFVQPLQFARDGVDAIAYLHGDGAYSDRTRFPLPTVMLLDLNMPRKNGFEVLEWIRQQPALKRLRVYIMSASSRPEDIRQAYDLGANSYLVKPGNLDGLMQLAKALVAWLRLSHFASLTDPVRGSDLTSGGPAGSSFRFGATPVSREVASAPTEQGVRKLAGNEAYRLNAQLERHLEESTAELAALRSDKENFGRSVGHDLRTPIMTIGGFADLLMERAGTQLDEQARQYLQKIITSTDELGRMVADIVARSKLRPSAPAGEVRRAHVAISA